MYGSRTIFRWKESHGDFYEQDSGIQIVRLSVSSGRGIVTWSQLPPCLLNRNYARHGKPREKNHFLGFRSKTDPSKWSTMGAERIDHAALSALLLPRIPLLPLASLSARDRRIVEGVRPLQWNVFFQTPFNTTKTNRARTLKVRSIVRFFLLFH